MRIFHLTVTSLSVHIISCASDCHYDRTGNDVVFRSQSTQRGIATSGSALLQSSQRRTPKVMMNKTIAALGANVTKQQRTHAEDGILVIVPGLGNRTRVPTVQRNVQWLRTQQVPIECYIYVYRTELEFPLDLQKLAPCKVVRHAGHWLSHMLALPLADSQMRWVLHMEDGTEPQSDVNLKEIFKIMVRNGLGHAAPTFDPTVETSEFCCTSIYPLLARQENVAIGRFVDFIELHFDIFTREYFSCLQKHIDASDDDMMIGWGMDKLLPALCGGAVAGSEEQAGRMGVLDHMTIKKLHYGSYTYWHAQRGLELFLGRHPYTPQPTFESQGELEAPFEGEMSQELSLTGELSQEPPLAPSIEMSQEPPIAPPIEMSQEPSLTDEFSQEPPLAPSIEMSQEPIVTDEFSQEPPLAPSW